MGINKKCRFCLLYIWKMEECLERIALSYMKGPGKRTAEDDERFAEFFENLVVKAQEV
ncbi:hypothetical protein [Jutongia sp.]|uniref:hypothetical protein n=1 Tax=Jutongia sp. TaxID=2944204 RepID=UPI00307A1DD0|nr:hypothetical protein [Clostridium sp.]